MHGGFEMLWRGRRHRIDMQRLTGGKSVMVYGQTELTRDLMEARRAADLPTVYEAADVAVHDFDGATPARHLREGRRAPRARLRLHRRLRRLSRRLPRERAAGRDHRIREGLPVRLAGPAVRHAARVARAHLRQQPARLRALLDAQPHAQPLLPAGAADREVEELVRRGLLATSCACASTTRARDALVTGPSLEKSIAPLRSFVAEPLRFGRLFLAGDAGHIVPPTGAKGLNLAATDVKYLRARSSSTTATAATPGSTPTRSAACAASGGPSGSRGGSPRSCTASPTAARSARSCRTPSSTTCSTRSTPRAPSPRTTSACRSTSAKEAPP